MSQAEIQTFNATSVTESKKSYAIGKSVGPDGLPLYVMQVSKKNGGTVEIVNTQTGKSLVVWGDPHTNINGKAFSDIYEDKTIILEDGTKVTFDVVPGENNSSVFYVQSVIVTSADGEFGIRADNLHSGGGIEVSKYEGKEDVKNLDNSIADGDWWQVTDKGSSLQETFTPTNYIANYKPMNHGEFLDAIINPAVRDPNAPDQRLMDISLEYADKISDANRIAEGDKKDSKRNIKK